MPKQDNYLDVLEKVRVAQKETIFLVSRRELPLYERAIKELGRTDLIAGTL